MPILGVCVCVYARVLPFRIHSHTYCVYYCEMIRDARTTYVL